MTTSASFEKSIETAPSYTTQLSLIDEYSEMESEALSASATRVKDIFLQQNLTSQFIPYDVTATIFSFLPTKLTASILLKAQKSELIQHLFSSLFSAGNSRCNNSNSLLVSSLLAQAPSSEASNLFKNLSGLTLFQDPCFFLPDTKIEPFLKKLPALKEFFCRLESRKSLEIVQKNIQKHPSLQNIGYSFAQENVDESHWSTNDLSEKEKSLFSETHSLQFTSTLEQIFSEDSETLFTNTLARKLAIPLEFICNEQSSFHRFDPIEQLLNRVFLSSDLPPITEMLFCTTNAIAQGHLKDPDSIERLKRCQDFILYYSQIDDEWAAPVFKNLFKSSCFIMIDCSKIEGHSLLHLSEELPLQQIDFVKCPKLDKTTVHQFLFRYPSLESLTYPFEITEDSSFFFAFFPKLRALQLIFDESAKSSDWNALFNRINSLKCLSLTPYEICTDTEETFPLCSFSELQLPNSLETLHLTHLTIAHPEEIFGKNLEQLFLRNCDSFKELNRCDSEEQIHSSLKTMGIIDPTLALSSALLSKNLYFPELKKLTIQGATLTNQLNNLKEKMPLLRELDLSACSFADPSVIIESFLQEMPLLQKIGLSSIKNLQLPLSTFFDRPDLTVLFLKTEKGTCSASFDEFQHLIKTTSLKILDVTGWKISDGTFLDLQKKNPDVRISWSSDEEILERGLNENPFGDD